MSDYASLVTNPMPPPADPDMRRQIKARLLALPPRAFELFAGDLLVFMGLRDVSVTRYVGDGGIDAYGSLETSAALISIPAGVQVKRHRGNVQRADIDRFIGASLRALGHALRVDASVLGRRIEWGALQPD
ncbi:MAG: restriction endonuclease [Chloroflexales bacterium]|nr:restriction endonuclease [Chloroflexales bacterium]